MVDFLAHREQPSVITQPAQLHLHQEVPVSHSLVETFKLSVKHHLHQVLVPSHSSPALQLPVLSVSVKASRAALPQETSKVREATHVIRTAVRDILSRLAINRMARASKEPPDPALSSRTPTHQSR